MADQYRGAITRELDIAEDAILRAIKFATHAKRQKMKSAALLPYLETALAAVLDCKDL